MKKTHIHVLPIIVFVLIGVIIYSNTFNVPFHFDDVDNIKAKALRIETFSIAEMSEALTQGKLVTRPVSNFSFALNYYLGGYRLQGYHFVNLLIHLFTGISIYYLFFFTLQQDVNREKYRYGGLIAFFTAFIWFVHPLATQSVTYLVQRMNSLSAMFFILSLLCYVLGRRQQLLGSGAQIHKKNAWWWFFCSGLTGLLAFGSKENSATLPVFIFLYEWFFFQDGNWRWLRRKLIWLAAIALSIFIIGMLYTNGHLFERLFNNHCGGRDFTAMERVLTEFRVVIYYIFLIFYPQPERLNLDYDFPLSMSLFSPLTTLYSLAGILALLLIAVVLFRRERLLSFCIFWFFGNLVIESSVICLEIIFEHRTYLPSMFFLLMLVALAYRLFTRPLVVTVALSLVAVVLAYWSYERNAVWQTGVSLWSDVVAKSPDKARPHVNLGRALAQENKFEEAERELRLGLSLDPEAHIANYNLATLLGKQGRAEEAESYYRETLRLKPDFILALVGFGEFLSKQERYTDAEGPFRHALSLVPDDAIINKNLGYVLLRLDRAGEALAYLEKSVSMAPDDEETLINIAKNFSLLGRNEEAIAVYREVLTKNSSQGDAHYHLAILLNEKGETEEALRHYHEADKLLTYPTDLKYDYANLLFRAGDLPKADRIYSDFLTIVPTVAMAYNNKGLTLVKQGRLQQAMEQFQLALRIVPTFSLAENNLRLVSKELHQDADLRSQNGTEPTEK
ncbi:MAG: tetratricopeptide repeat protein [Desulfopila sp.]